MHSEELVQQLYDSLQADNRLFTARRFVVAFSGGLDSTVLLDLVRRALPVAGGPGLAAVYVDHQLQPGSAEWAGHCENVAADMGVDLEIRRIDAGPRPGASPEAAARAARYDALATVLGDGDVLLTAHHRDDQVETVLLQLVRGGGVAGLAGMPVLSRIGTALHWRPLLAVPRERLREYAARAGLSWIEDPSNTHLRYDRNFVRHEILPKLAERWPGAAGAVTRSARHSAEAAELMREVGAEDAGQAAAGTDTLSVSALAGLSPQRRRNALRRWIELTGMPMPGTAHVVQVLELLDSREAGGCVSWPGVELRRYRDRLYVMQPIEPLPNDFEEILHPGSAIRLPAGLGQLRAAGQPAQLTVRFRRGGERLRPRGSAHRRALRNLFQESGVVPWMRDRIPLVFTGNRLLAVADLWLEHELAASQAGAGLEVSWKDHPRLY